ncbi:MAG: hypothetical protein JWN67_558 [Actinomycetia bacterium]|jgi:hypothetical protein|nr:hypothetical protein [Actinomycetes bacterium]
MVAAVVTPAVDPARGPEAEIISDMLRRGLPALPVLVLLAGLGWGWHGAMSGAFAVGLVLVNFGLTAIVLSVTGRISPTALMAGVLVGYAARMGLVVLALYLVKHTSWAEMVPLGIVLVVTHLGLLFWELRHVSASLAFPGLKPAHRSAPEESSS